jgi:hypothetical protein
MKQMSNNIHFNYCNTHIDLYLAAGVLYQALEIIFHCQLRFLQRFFPFFYYCPLNCTFTQYTQHQFDNLFSLITALDGPAASWSRP